MATWINLSLQGTVYFTSRRSTEDEDMLQLYSSKLLGVTKESTFEALYLQIARKWRQRDDIVNPFKDRRGVFVSTVWIFDLDSDALRLDKKNQNLRIPLSFMRHRSVSITDFEPYELPLPSECTLQSIFKPPYWKMRRNGVNLQNLERCKAFICRVFADFSFQWQNILCGRYNKSTFQRLASAIIKIATLDFNVVERTGSGHGEGGYLVELNDLPEWEPFSRPIIQIGRTSVVLSQHIQHAVTLIREDFGDKIISSLKRGASEPIDDSFTYLILSVQAIVLYRISRESERYAKPKRLFDGKNPPSDEAVELLLEATQSSAPTNPIQSLPLEIQDMIISKVSEGPIERARIACILNVGSIFRWKSGDRDIERQEGKPHRTSFTPVESHIRFGNHSSGVAYR